MKAKLSYILTSTIQISFVLAILILIIYNFYVCHDGLARRVSVSA